MAALPQLKPARIAALAAVAALLLLAAAASWLVLTEAGLARIVAVAESLDALQVRVDGAQGRLAGPLRIDRLEIENKRLRIDATGIDADYDPSGLLFGRLRIAALQADSLALTIRPPAAPPAERKPQFLPRWLTLSVGDLRVTRAVIANPERTLLELTDLHARGTVSHARIILREVAVDAGTFAVAGEARLRAGDPLLLEGKLDFTVGPEQQLAGRLEAQGDLDRLVAVAEITAPFDGTLSATLTDLTTDLAWQAVLDLARLDLAELMTDPPLGPLSGRASGSGSLERISLEAQLDAAGLPAGGVNLTTHFSRDGQTLDIDVLSIEVNGSEMSVEASGRVALAEPRGVELEATWRQLRWPFEGAAQVASATGRLSLQGWSPLLGQVVAQVAVPDLPPFEVEAQGMLSELGLLLTQGQAAGPLGRVSATGFLGFGEQRPWRVAAEVAELDIGQVRPGFDSRLAFSATASGSGSGPGLAWAGALSGLSGTVRGQPASGDGLVRYQPGRLEFEQLHVDLGPARFTADGRIGTDTRLAAELRADDLSGFSAELGGSIDARLDARSAPAGDGLLIDLALRGRDITYGNERAAVLSADAVLDLSGTEPSWARVRAAGLTLGGQSIASTRLSLDGRARDHSFVIQVGAGERAVELEGTGSLVDGVYRLLAAEITAAGPDVQPWELEAPMAVMASADSAEVERTCLVFDVRRVCFAAQWRRGQRWSVALDTEAFPLQALDVTLPGRPGYEGLLDLDVALEGLPGQPWTGRSVARLREGKLTYLTPSRREEQLGLGITELTVDSGPDQHRLSLAIGGTALIQLAAEATIERRPGVAFSESLLVGQLELVTRELGLLPLLVPEIDRAGGLLRADLSFAGPISGPELGGSMSLEDGNLDLYNVNLRMTDLAARFEFDDSGLRLDAGGRMGEGKFAVTGTLSWQQREMVGGFELSGERLLLANLPELRVEASPALTFTLDGRRIAVTGSVTVPEARIEPEQFAGAVIPSADEVLITRESKEEDPTEGYQVSTDVRLILGRRVAINAFGLKGRLEGEVLLRTRPGEVPIASGELQITDAEYRAYGRELEVERGRLLFPGGPLADPGIDLRARRELPGYEVGVIVRGHLRRPELTLYSIPSLPQSQIAALLVVGRTLDSLQTGDRQSLGSSSDLAAQGGALLAGQVGRYIGLDEVAFEPALDDKDASLVLGKFLSPRFYIGYGISLTNSINTFKLRYTIGDRWIIRLEASENSSVDIEYTIDR